MGRKSRGDPGDRQRQQSLRGRRKAAGWRRVSIWLSPEQVARLTRHGGTAGLGRTVKRLLVWADPDLGAENALDDGARRADDRAAAVSETVPPTPCQDGSSAASGTQRSPLRDNDREDDPKRPEKSPAIWPSTPLPAVALTADGVVVSDHGIEALPHTAGDAAPSRT